MLYKPLPQDDPKKRKPDISLAQTKLNWQPRVTVEEGLSKIIDHYRQEILVRRNVPQKTAVLKSLNQPELSIEMPRS